jgi:hypothetical protein
MRNTNSASITLHRRTRPGFGAVHRIYRGHMGFCGHLPGGILKLLGRCGAASGGLAEANLFAVSIVSGQGCPPEQRANAQKNTDQCQARYACRDGLRQLFPAKAALKSAGEEGRSARRTLHD